MNERFERTEKLLGDTSMKKLNNARVAVFGIGGVGGNAAEALVRSGIGNIDLIDNDTVSLSNINRQLFALENTVGMNKVDVAKDRLLLINPQLNIKTYKTFFLPENAHTFDFSSYDYVLDAIDTVSGKISLIMCANECGTPIISSMGAGNKLDPTQFEVTDIYKTSVCHLAKVMRHELKKRGIRSLKVVYSKESPLTPQKTENDLNERKRSVPGSVAFVPPVVGLIMAGEVIKDIIKTN